MALALPPACAPAAGRTSHTCSAPLPTHPFPPLPVDPSSWLMYKLGQPVSPWGVVFNGSQSQHAVGDEGVSVDSTDGATRLYIRCAAAGHGAGQEG